MSGHGFVFINRRRTQLKCLYFDTGGYCVWSKRLRRGQFGMTRAASQTTMALSRTAFEGLIEGLDLIVKKQRKRWHPAIQPSLFAGLIEHAPPPRQTETRTITRRKKTRDGAVNDSGLRFDDTVPVSVIEVAPPAELEDDEVIATHSPFRVCPTPNAGRIPGSIRKAALEALLAARDVPIDTNHLERGPRPIPMGRRNWVFCWTEVGAERVGIIQGLISTCRLQGVDPYTYLVDVLQRIGLHPAKRVAELTPRLWKTRFADHPLRSDID